MEIAWIICTLLLTDASLMPEYDLKKDERRAQKYKLFPNGIVNYKFASENYKREMQGVAKAIKQIENETCLAFAKYPTDTHKGDPFTLVINISNFGTNNGNGTQNWEFNFEPGSYKAPLKNPVVHVSASEDYNILMARLLNAVAGLKYEHQRSDRDKHVLISTNNIREGAGKNFVKIAGYPPNLPEFQQYAYNSIMSMGQYYQSRNNNPTITTLGSRHLEEHTLNITIDMMRVNAVYRQLIHKWYFRGSLFIYKGPLECALDTKV